MTNGSIPLGIVAERARKLDIACSRCERRGRYTLARLVETYGADFPMTNLGAELADCPNRNQSSHGKRCDVYFPGLIAIMAADT